MKDVTLLFTFVMYKDRAFAHHLDVSPFPSNFISSSLPGPFWRANEELGRSMEVVDLLKSKILKFTCFVIQVQDDCAYPLGIDDPTNIIDLFIFPCF